MIVSRYQSSYIVSAKTEFERLTVFQYFFHIFSLFFSLVSIHMLPPRENEDPQYS